MRRSQTLAKWQLRLPPDEDAGAQKIADRRRVSKADVVRHALRLFLRLEMEIAAGSRLLIERPGKRRDTVEIWLLG